MNNNDFIIENGILEAYLGDTNESVIVIPEGVTDLGSHIFPDKMNEKLTIVFPSTLREISSDYPFKGNNVDCLDFSKCKSNDFKNIKLNDKFEKVILPVTISNFNPNFIYNKVTVRCGGKEYQNADFSMCKHLKELSLKNLNNASFDTYQVPDSVEKFYTGYSGQNIVIKDLKFSSKSNAKIVDVNGVETITVPKSIEELYAGNAKWVFFEGTSLDLYEASLQRSYVVENVDIDSIKSVDKFSTKGVAYYQTSRGIFITKLNNEIAKFQDIPQILDGKKVLGNTLYNPFSKNKTNEDSDFGELAPKIKYRANRNLQKTEDIFNGKLKTKKVTVDKKDEDDPWLNVWKIPKWKKILFYLCGIVASYLVVTLAFLFLNGIAKQNPDGGMGIKFMIGIIPVGLFVSLVVDGFIVFRIIGKIESRNIKNMDTSRIERVRQQFKNSYLLKIYEYVDEPYRWIANDYAWKLYEEDKRRKDEQARIKRQHDKAMDELLHGTKEEQQRKAIASKLDELNKNLRESNNSSSYDLYDSSGSKIGEIEKK